MVLGADEAEGDKVEDVDIPRKEHLSEVESGYMGC